MQSYCNAWADVSGRWTHPDWQDRLADEAQVDTIVL